MKTLLRLLKPRAERWRVVVILDDGKPLIWETDADMYQVSRRTPNPGDHWGPNTVVSVAAERIHS